MSIQTTKTDPASSSSLLAYRLLILLLLVLINSACSKHEPLLIDKPLDQISIAINHKTPALMDKFKVTGLSVGIIRDGELSIEESLGFSRTTPTKKLDENTVFRAASLGKPIFAYIVVTLAQQGLLNLDTPLFEYINVRMVDNDDRSLLVTARMVLSHTTGLPNLNVESKEYKFHFTPGSEFLYSGHGYLYLQKVIELLSGKSLQQLASQLVFKPLSMTSSSYVWQTNYLNTIASSYDANGKRYPTGILPESGYSAWSLFTTMQDYSRFVSHILKTSEESNSVASVLLTPEINVADGVAWGLGWGLQETPPYTSFWHWGSLAGFRHFVVGYPKEKIAVIVMSNNDQAFKIADKVMSLAIGGDYPAYDWF
ncbi:MAG: serine hydrolase domain-containing protein [Candidatus Thiodiazotropha sp. DIVDIV]